MIARLVCLVIGHMFYPVGVNSRGHMVQQCARCAKRSL